jgi:hypothetical protein
MNGPPISWRNIGQRLRIGLAKRKTINPMDDYYFEKDTTTRRGNYVFFLPLPIKHMFATVGDCYIELMACRTDKMQLLSIYSCQFFREWALEKDPLSYMQQLVGASGQKRTKGWIGGAEFMLRKEKVLPSPQSLAGDIDGDGSMACTDVMSEKQASSDTNNKTGSNATKDGDGDVYDAITNYIRSCPFTGIEYLREILYHVKMAMRKPIVNPKKAYSFTNI